jgi:hypothetical protein
LPRSDSLLSSRVAQQEQQRFFHEDSSVQPRKSLKVQLGVAGGYSSIYLVVHKSKY